MTGNGQLLLLATSWVVYALLHSLLASLWLKRRVEKHFHRFMPAYRLIYNLVAVVLLSIPLWLLYTYQGEPLIQWSGYLAWVSHLLAILAVAGFILSLRYYDGGEFLGLRQLRGNVTTVEDQENFHISPLHRYVRHPWYFLALVLLWSRDMNAAFLLSVSLVTLYFVLGSKAEERKLVHYHGDVYREYLSRVPGLFPLPWKYLTAAEADRLIKRSRQ